VDVRRKLCSVLLWQVSALSAGVPLHDGTHSSFPLSLMKVEAALVGPALDCLELHHQGQLEQGHSTYSRHALVAHSKAVTKGSHWD
jgi:hypothetical protein